MKKISTFLISAILGVFLLGAIPAKAQPKVYMEKYPANGGPVYYYDTIDENPTFKGGDYQTFRYWVRTRRDNRGGQRMPGDKVTALIIVDTQGKAHAVSIDTGKNEKEKKTMTKILAKIPDWTPGRHNGEAVNTLVTYRINYSE